MQEKKIESCEFSKIESPLSGRTAGNAIPGAVLVSQR